MREAFPRGLRRETIAFRFARSGDATADPRMKAKMHDRFADAEAMGSCLGMRCHNNGCRSGSYHTTPTPARATEFRSRHRFEAFAEIFCDRMLILDVSKHFFTQKIMFENIFIFVANRSSPRLKF